MERSHCSPVTLDRRNSATLHRPQSREMPAASEGKKKKKGLHLFCRKKNTQGWERRKRIWSLKMTKFWNGSAHTSPEGQAARQTMQESPAESQLPFFFSPRLWPPSLAQPHRAGEYSKPNALHHRGMKTPMKNPRASQHAKRNLQITGVYQGWREGFCFA